LYTGVSSESAIDHIFYIPQILEKKMGIKEAVHQLFIDIKKAYDSVIREALYNILIEFGTPVKLVRLITMCLNETYTRVWVGKHLSDIFPIKSVLKQGDDLSSLFFNFALVNAIRRVQVNQDGLKLNGTYQLIIHAHGTNITGGSIHIIRENKEALVIASKEIGLEVNADKIKYMVKSQDNNAGRSHIINTDNSSFERMEEFK
jgi:hypothetical protein